MLDRTAMAQFEDLPPAFESITLKSRQAGEAQGTFLEYGLQAKFKRAKREQVPDPLRGILAALLASEVRVIQFWDSRLSAASAQGAAELPCPEPKINDLVVRGADGTTWLILDVDDHSFGAVRNCLSRKIVGQ